MRKAWASLSERQREIAILLGTTPLSIADIAGELDLAEGTVRKVAESCRRKLGVHTRLQLMLELFDWYRMEVVGDGAPEPCDWFAQQCNGAAKGSS